VEEKKIQQINNKKAVEAVDDTQQQLTGSLGSQSNNPQQRTNSEIIQDIHQNPRN